MPLTAEQEKALKPLLLKGTLATDASLEPFLAAVEPDLLAALGTDHPLAGDSLQLRRFLVARKLKVPATVEMISAHVKWRAENLPIEPEGAVLAELQKGKFYSYGTDAAGRPLVLIHSGKFDPATRDLEASVRSVFYEIERVIAQLPPGQAQFAVFYDRTGFSIKKNWDYTLLKAVFTQLSDNYPERLGAGYVYPSGKLLPMLWGLVKHFLDARTRSKVKFINTQEELLKSLPAEYVPTAYGGSSTHAFDPATCGLVSGE